MDVLGLKDYEFITVSPNKTNIKYIVKNVDPQIESSMIWILDIIRQMKENFPRTIIYCNSIRDVGQIYNFLVTELSDMPKIEELIEMYHSETSEEKKAIENLTNDSLLRVVVATSALGMGVNVASCHNVIRYGPPKSAVDFLQETGRVGRDGQHSCAILLFHGHQLRNVDQDIKNFLKSTECRRLQILKPFLSDEELRSVQSTSTGQHVCCDICEQICSCQSCSLTVMEKAVKNLPFVDDIMESSGSDSDSDTISYEYDSGDDLNNDTN